MSAKNKNQPLQLPHKSPSPRNNYKSDSSIQETPLYEPTKRTFGEVQNHVGQDFYQKQTERNYNRSGQMMIWLTQSDGSEKNSEGDWSIHLDSPARQQKINEICHILQQKGLMKAFQAFNELRELIANDLVQQQGEVTHKFKLIEAIERFSNRFNMSRTLFYSDQSNKKQEYKQIKGYLQEITFLRAQNAKLKNKIQNYSSKLQKNQCRFDEMDNSLLNNSISFHSYTSTDSANKSDQSFQIRLDKEFVKPFVIVKQPYCDEQSTLAVLTESIEVERKNCQHNYVAEADSILIGMDNKQTQTDSYQRKQDYLKTIQLGKNVLIKSVIALKSMLTLCVESVNQAVIRYPKSLQLLSQLVEKINTFRPSAISEKQDDFLHKILQVINFTSLMNSSLRKIFRKQDGSHNFNKENLQFQ